MGTKKNKGNQNSLSGGAALIQGVTTLLPETTGATVTGATTTGEKLPGPEKESLLANHTDLSVSVGSNSLTNSNETSNIGNATPEPEWIVPMKLLLEKINYVTEPPLSDILTNYVNDMIERKNEIDKKKAEDFIQQIESLLQKETERKKTTLSLPLSPSDSSLTKKILDTLKTKDYVDPDNQYVIKKTDQTFSIGPYKIE